MMGKTQSLSRSMSSSAPPPPSLVAKVWTVDVVAQQQRTDSFLPTFFTEDVGKTVHT